jgi:hypothetical protein
VIITDIQADVLHAVGGLGRLLDAAGASRTAESVRGALS